MMIPIEALITAACVCAYINRKNLPFSWHVRLYTTYLISFYYRPTPRPEQLFEYKTYSTSNPLLECDIFGHKSNSTYNMDLDIARSDLLMYLLRGWFNSCYEVDGVSPFLPMGNVQTYFKKEIKPLVKYDIKSRVIGWEHKWFYVISLFVLPKTGQICAIALTKFCAKRKGKTIAVEEVLTAAGLSTPENLERGRMDFQDVKIALDFESVLDDLSQPKSKL